MVARGAGRLCQTQRVTYQGVIDALLIVVLVGWFGYRQSTWRPFVPGQMLRGPLVIGVVGLVVLVQSAKPLAVIDVVALVIELLVSLGVGALMGAIAHFRVAPGGGVQTRRGLASHESRTGWWGLVLWVALILFRIAMDVVGAQLGAVALTSTGVILVLLATNRIARVWILERRLQRSGV